MYGQGGADWTQWTVSVTDGAGAVTEVSGAECDGSYQAPVDMPASSSSDNWDRRQGSYYNKLMVPAQATNIPTGSFLIQDAVMGDFYYAYTGASFTHDTHYHVSESYSSSKVRLVSPSEHTIDGTSYALELQIYAGRLGDDESATKHAHLIYSVLFEADDTAPADATAAAAIAEGADNWDDRWGALIFGQSYQSRSKFSTARGSTGELPVGDLLMENVAAEYWNYDGSNTQLPCDQFADVIVSTKTYKVHSDVVALYTQNYAGNAAFGSHGNNRNV